AALTRRKRGPLPPSETRCPPWPPVTTVAMVPNVLVVNAERTPSKTVAELVELAKKSSPELAYGSNGNGTAQHLIGTQFQLATGAKLLHVPYKGSGPLTTDLLGGQVAMSFDTLTPVLPHIEAGKLRALAVTTAKRSSTLPDLPTLQEAGLGDRKSTRLNSSHVKISY